MIHNKQRIYLEYMHYIYHTHKHWSWSSLSFQLDSLGTLMELSSLKVWGKVGIHWGRGVILLITILYDNGEIQMGYFYFFYNQQLRTFKLIHYERKGGCNENAAKKQLKLWCYFWNNSMKNDCTALFLISNSTAALTRGSKMFLYLFLETF